MLKESIEEYKEICTLVRECSSAVMRYSTTAVAVSGALFAALISIRSPEIIHFLPLIIITLSNITLFMVVIINYKCSSHNRLAAYRQIISSECFDEDFKDSVKFLKSTRADPAISFDVCMDHLNNTYAKQHFDFNIVKGEFFARKGVFRKLDGPHDIDKFVAEAFPSKIRLSGAEGIVYGKIRHDSLVKRKIFPALWFLAIFLMPGRHPIKGTWQFPDKINRTLCFIVILEFFVSFGIFCNEITKYQNSKFATQEIIYVSLSSFCNEITKNQSPNFITQDILAIILYIFELIIFIRLLQQVSIEWQELMIGGKRIFSYFVQFVPFRMIYLKQMLGYFDHDQKNPMPLHISYFIGTEWEFDNNEETNKAKCNCL